jgi:hypothetical protein
MERQPAGQDCAVHAAALLASVKLDRRYRIVIHGSDAAALPASVGCMQERPYGYQVNQ